MQEQNVIEKPIIFISYILSGQATRWGIMELELYAFVICVKQLSPYLMGKLFTVMKVHKNIVSREFFDSWSIGEYYFQSSDFSSITSRAFKTLWPTDSLQS